MNELLDQFKLVIIGFVVLLALSLLAVFYPIQKIMEGTISNSFRAEAGISLTTLNNFVSSCVAESTVLATRPSLRQNITDYKYGLISIQELTALSLPCYTETASTLQNCVVAIRVVDNRVLACYGNNILDNHEILLHRSSEANVTLYHNQGHPYFLVTCPIKAGNRYIAWDYVLYDSAPLLEEVTREGYRYQIVARDSFKPNTNILRKAEDLYDQDGYTFFHKEIKNSNALLLVNVDNRLLFKPVKATTYRTVIIIFLTLLATLLLLYLSVYTTARKLVTKLESYNNQLGLEKLKVEKLASGQRDLFNIFRALSECWTLDDDFKVLKASLPYIINYRNFLMAVHSSRTANHLEIKEVTGDYSLLNPAGLFGEKSGIMEEVLKTGKPCFTSDLPAENLRGLYRQDVNSLIIVPIIYKGFTWGLIAIDHLEKQAFSQLDFELMDMLASHIALHLEEMEAKRKLNMQAVRLRSLHELISQMALERDNLKIIAQLLVDLLEAADLQALGVYRLDHSGEPMTFKVLLQGGKTKLLPSPNGKYLEVLRQVATSRSLQIIEIEPNEAYMLVTPVVYRDVLHGILCTVKSDGFSEADIDIVWILVNYLAIFWELNLLLHRMEREALIDPLTAVWNRRYMMKQIEIEDDKLKRHGGECCLAIIDLGNFKLINDRYGHSIGDEVLKITAATIANIIRSADSVGRYGGDEFIILLPSTSPEQAAAVMDRINLELGMSQPEGIDGAIFADYGIACCPLDTPSLMDAINIADKRMYHNKRSRKG